MAAGTGSTAAAHGLDTGILEPGRPADLLVLGPITGSTGQTALECLELGDGRSEQTPPPSSKISWR